MTTFTVDLSPSHRPEGSEGALDSSISTTTGLSAQRTTTYLYIKDGSGNKKIIGNKKDGATFDDTTFQGVVDLDFVI